MSRRSESAGRTREAKTGASKQPACWRRRKACYSAPGFPQRPSLARVPAVRPSVRPAVFLSPKREDSICRRFLFPNSEPFASPSRPHVRCSWPTVKKGKIAAAAYLVFGNRNSADASDIGSFERPAGRPVGRGNNPGSERA